MLGGTDGVADGIMLRLGWVDGVMLVVGVELGNDVVGDTDIVG